MDQRIGFVVARRACDVRAVIRAKLLAAPAK
jgi:hypothetical protein